MVTAIREGFKALAQRSQQRIALEMFADDPALKSHDTPNICSLVQTNRLSANTHNRQLCILRSFALAGNRCSPVAKRTPFAKSIFLPCNHGWTWPHGRGLSFRPVEDNSNAERLLRRFHFIDLHSAIVAYQSVEHGIVFLMSGRYAGVWFLSADKFGSVVNRGVVMPVTPLDDLDPEEQEILDQAQAVAARQCNRGRSGGRR